MIFEPLLLLLLPFWLTLRPLLTFSAVHVPCAPALAAVSDAYTSTAAAATAVTITTPTIAAAAIPPSVPAAVAAAMIS
jgi:hypothetical protein